MVAKNYLEHLPKTSKSGGGGGFVNTFINIFGGSSNEYTTSDGLTYLKSGYLESDLSKYPEAHHSPLEDTGESVSFTRDTDMNGITYGAGYLWVVGASTDDVYQLNLDMHETGFSFPLSSQGSPTGIAYANNHLYVLDGSARSVKKYSLDGTFTGDTYPTTQDTIPTGICFDGEFFWISGNNNNRLYKYTQNMTYTNHSVSISGVSSNSYGVASSLNVFAVIDYTTGLHITDKTGSSIGSVLVKFCSGLTFSPDGFLYLCDKSNKTIRKFGSGLVGYPFFKFDVSTGTPLYVRVK